MIRVNCLRPKRLKGKYEFSGFEESARWFITKIRSGKNDVGPWLCNLAENGVVRDATGWYCIEAKSDFYGGYPMKELAREIGVIKTKWGGDSYPKDPGLALQYAKRLDLLSQGEEVPHDHQLTALQNCGDQRHH